MSQVDKRFLVRSAGQILGPYSKEEVIGMIKRGQVSIFDEVAEPFTIWLYLQDHDDFKAIVYSMDIQARLTNFITQISRKFSTESRSKSLGGQTITETQDLTKDTQPGDLAELDTQDKKTALEVKVKTMNQPAAKPSSDIKYRSQKDSEEALRTRIGWIVKTVWWSIIALSLFISAYIFYKEIVIPVQVKKEARNEFKNHALKLYEAGDYKRALPLFEQARSNNILQEEEGLWFASLLLWDNQLQKASLVVSELVNSSLKGSEGWFLLNGLLSLYQGDFQSAEKYFRSVKGEKGSVALLNLSLVQWERGDYVSSMRYLNSFIKEGHERDIVSYLRALSLLFQNRLGDLSSYLDQGLLLNKKKSLVREYKQELYLMQAYSYLQEEKPEETRKVIQKLLNEDPFFSKEYQYSSFLALNVLNWDILFPYCENIFKSDPQDSLLNALYGFCYLKTNRLRQGARYIDQAKKGAPDDSLFLALYAYLLMLEKKDVQVEQALSLIDYSKLEEGQTLPFILKASYLESQKDWMRALDVWKSLLSHSLNHLSGIVGMAVTSFHLEDYSTAEVYKNKGLSEYPYHVELLSYDNWKSN